MTLAHRVKNALDLDGGSEYLDTFLEKVRVVFSKENMEYFFMFCLLGIIYSYVPVAWFQKIAEYFELY